MGFLSPWALLALPLAALPILLAWHGRRAGEPVRFSSLYLVERARERATRSPTRSRWIVLVRCAILALLVLAAARPVGPGAGDPALHHPTRAIVAVDVSRSALQRVDGAPAWEAIAAAADSLLAAAAPDDRVALAAVADGLVGWWEGSPPALRGRLRGLQPTARASDWPAVLEGLARREEPGVEVYLVTDGSVGARGPGAKGASDPGATGGSEPDAARGPDAGPTGGPAASPAGERYEREPSSGAAHRVVRVTGAAGEPNRALTGARRVGPDRVAPLARAWARSGAPPEVADAGRRVGERLAGIAAIPLDGTIGATTWVVEDTATFALADGDPLPDDDVWRVAGGLGRAGYRIARWAPADEPPDPGPLFWEAALEASGSGAPVERHASLEALVRAAPALALLPIRGYGPAEAGLLAELTAGGTRLLFVPACPDAACAPTPGWMPAAGPDVPDLRYRLAPADRRTTLSARPGGVDAPVSGPPAPLLERVPVRGSLVPIGGPPADRRWDLRSGEPAFRATGPTALWLVPLGAPVTRLAETPLFPLVVDAALSAWDPRWRAGAGGTPVGRPLPVPDDGARVTGPLHEPDPRSWRVGAGEAPPRPERVGIYRVEPSDVRAGSGEANFVAVHADPAEGDLTPVPAAAWSAWGRVATTAEGWRAAWFPRRRGADLWPWILALALAGLVVEARLVRGRREA